MKWPLAAILLVLCTGRAEAADWVPLANAGTADRYYYDRSKLTIKGNEITYWKKVEFQAPQLIQGREAVSGLLRERIDCAEHTARLVSYLYYSAAGETVEYVASSDAEAAPIIPDTVGDAFERALCPRVWRKQEAERIQAEQKAAAAELAAQKRQQQETQPPQPEPTPGRLPEPVIDPDLGAGQ